MLQRATAPLITGVANLTSQAQPLAWQLADLVGGYIDTDFNDEGRAATFAFQRHGRVAASLGEVANRSDVVVYWFCDPEATHPRHVRRFARGNKKENVRVVVFDDHRTATADAADVFFQIDRKHATALLQAWRGCLGDDAFNLEPLTRQTGLQSNTVRQWLSMLTGGKYVSLFCGESTENLQIDTAAEQLHRLVRALNDETRCVLGTLSGQANGAGAQSFLSALSGFPFGISHLRGKPEFDGMTYTSLSLLRRRQCDAVLAFGSVNSFKMTDSEAVDYLNTIDRAEISPGLPSIDPTTFIPVGIPGFNGGGDFTRQDGITLPLRPVSNRRHPSAADVLTLLMDAVQQDD